MKKPVAATNATVFLLSIAEQISKPSRTPDKIARSILFISLSLILLQSRFLKKDS
jgi:hypothetical protein